ncbi:MAG: hypothetical protein WAK01_01265 [Methylocystis sp.]
MRSMGADLFPRLAAGLSLFVLLATGHPARAGDTMSFSLVSPQVIAAQGQIDDGTAQSLVEFLQQNGGRGHRILLLDSPGGHVQAAMELGATIRRLGLAVVVARPGGGGASDTNLPPGICYSACVYALMGGTRRVVPPQSRVATHRMYNYETNFDAAQGGFVSERYYDDGGMRRKLANYARRMGVDSGIIDSAERGSSDQVHVLTRAEIQRWRLASQRM